MYFSWHSRTFRSQPFLSPRFILQRILQRVPQLCSSLFYLLITCTLRALLSLSFLKTHIITQSLFLTEP